MKTSPWSKAAARAYCGGDFQHFAQYDEIAPEDLAACGDTLFRFLMIELSRQEGCDSRDEAIRRCESACRDIEQVIAALEAL
jgi:hypothetical protein